MADDVTLTVRVRDLTRGEFDRLGRRLNSVGDGVRRVGDASGHTSEEMNRLAQGVQGVEGRLRRLQQTGGAARHDMTHMRRSMGLLDRELRRAARSGQLTEDQFRSLSNALERSRLDFDHLNNDIERHSAIANRAHREEMARQREAEAEARRAARAEELRNRRVAQDSLAAARRQAREEERAQREATAVRMAALRRRHQQEAEERRRAQSEERAEMNRMRSAGGSTDFSVRFRVLNNDDLNRLHGSLYRLQDGFRGINGAGATSQRRIGGLTRDLSAMDRILSEVGRTGTLTRRDLSALNGGLTLVTQGARQLRRSGDITRAMFRAMQGDVQGLRAQMTLLSGEGTRFQRVNAHLRIFQSRLRQVDEGAGGTRRSMRRMGDWGLTGLIAATAGLGRMAAMLGAILGLARANRRVFAILLATLVLIGPAAQAIGALLLTALGGAFIALGALALKGNAEVISSFKEMKNSVVSTMREAAAPMKGDLVVGIEQVGAAFRAMGPQLRGAFAAAGPLISDFFGGFTDFVGSALPGFTFALRNSGQAMSGFRSAMALVGQGFGDMMRIITGGNQSELEQTWVVLGNEIRNVLVSLGEFISTALNSGTATTLMIGVFRAFTGALNVVAFSLEALDAIFGDFFAGILTGVTGVKALANGTKLIGDNFGTMGKDLPKLKSDLEGVTAEIKALENTKLDGPAADYQVSEKSGKTLKDLKAEQVALAAAVAAAEAEASEAYSAQARSIHDVISAMTELNQQQISRLDAKSAVEESIDKAAEAAKKYKAVLKMVGGDLSLGTEKEREAFAPLSKLAADINKVTEESEKAKVPIQQMNAEFANSKQAFIDSATAMFGNADAAKILAEQILHIPGQKLITIEMIKDQARSDLEAFNSAVRASPGTKSVTLKTLSKEAEQILRAFGYKVERLPDGSVRITAAAGGALSDLASVASRVNALDGRVATVTVKTFTKTIDYGSISAGTARGGLASGGPVSGPGTGTSDSIIAAVSDGEFVVRAASVRKYGPQFMEALNEGRLEVSGAFARGGQVSKAMRDARNSARGELSISHFGRMAGYKNNEFRGQLTGADTIGELVNALNKWRSIIQKATSGGIERSLLRKLDSAGRALFKYERAHAKVTKSLDSAKAKLNDLKESAKRTSESVRDGVLSSASVTRLADGDKRLTMGDVMGGMRQGRDKAVAFAKALEGLRKKGVSKDVIGQVAEAGISGGGLETAGALLSASAADVKSLNKFQAEINKAAGAAGKSASDAMYLSGIRAAEGLIKGLDKQKKNIEKAMMNIAKSMEKAIKRALGIKSPSRVMQEIGDHTAEGFAIGVRQNRGKDQAWASMLNAPPSRASSGGGGGRVVLEINSSGSAQDEFLLQLLRKAIRVRGGDVQVVLGKGR